MSFMRTKVLAAALLATLAVSTPSIAGFYSDRPMMGDEDDSGYGSDYGPGSGRAWRMMRERMMERDNSPEWRMMRRHLLREWMRHHGYGDEGMGYGGRGMMGGGYGQQGWMMRRFGGMGPGMMYGYGYGSERRNLNLTTDQVKNYLNRMIRNPNLTVGNVTEKDANSIMAEIVTKQGNSLVQRLDFNRRTGFVRPEGQQSGTSGAGQNEEQENQSGEMNQNQNEESK